MSTTRSASNDDGGRTIAVGSGVMVRLWPAVVHVRSRHSRGSGAVVHEAAFALRNLHATVDSRFALRMRTDRCWCIVGARPKAGILTAGGPTVNVKVRLTAARWSPPHTAMEIRVHLAPASTARWRRAAAVRIVPADGSCGSVSAAESAGYCRSESLLSVAVDSLCPSALSATSGNEHEPARAHCATRQAALAQPQPSFATNWPLRSSTGGMESVAAAADSESKSSGATVVPARRSRSDATVTDGGNNGKNAHRATHKRGGGAGNAVASGSSGSSGGSGLAGFFASLLEPQVVASEPTIL